MARDHGTEFRVGLFVMVALVIGAALAFIIGNQRDLWRSKVTYRAVFESVGGLRPGSPVRIAGVNVGTVDRVDLGEDGLIHVEFGVISDATALVREDSLATIGNKGLLGDKLVDIAVGSGQRLPPGGTIPSESPVELSQYLSKAGSIIGNVEQTVENLRRVTEPLASEEFTSDLRETTHNLALITRMAANEDGALAQLMTDEEMGQRFDDTLRNVQIASAELAGTARSARSILGEIRGGDGTAHELIYGEEGSRLVTNLADTSGEVAQLMRDVRTGDGMMHDLVYEDTGDEVMGNVTAMSADLRAIVADVRAGRGTVGGLLVDPSVYEDVKRLVGNLERNEILRALVRYSIRRDEAEGQIDVEGVADSP